MTLKTPEMTGTKLKFWSKFRFRLYSVPATGRNFAGILNLVGIDLSDFNADDIVDDLNLFKEEDVTVNNESGLVDGSDPDNTKATSTAAGDLFDSSSANEVAEKDKRQQEAEERANNQLTNTEE